MNKRKGALFLALCLVLAGCGQGAGAETNVETEIAESIGIQNESAMPDTEDADAKNSVSETGETQNTKTAAQEPETEVSVENTTEPKYLTLDISTMGETLADGDAVDPIGLTILSEEENGVSWANDWYDSENLSLPMIGTDWNSFYDDHYQYQWVDASSIFTKPVREIASMCWIIRRISGILTATMHIWRMGFFTEPA